MAEFRFPIPPDLYRLSAVQRKALDRGDILWNPYRRDWVWGERMPLRGERVRQAPAARIVVCV